MTPVRNPAHVYTQLTSPNTRLGFFTNDNRETIPEAPGCYGWFLPLWLRFGHDTETLPDFLRSFGRVLSHAPALSVEANYPWEALELKLRRKFKWSTAIPEKVNTTWVRLNRQQATRDILQPLLLQASILTPPLYVGTATNLRRRYTNHVKDHSSDFHTRFRELSDQYTLDLDVRDLLYVCIATDHSVHNLSAPSEDSAPINDLLEEILKRLCRAPLSLK